MSPEQLAEIRARDAEVDGGDGSPMPFVSQAEQDRHALLVYIDDLAEQIVGIEVRVGEVLGGAQLLLGMKLMKDGHASTLGDAIGLAQDLDAVAKLYPEVPV